VKRQRGTWQEEAGGPCRPEHAGPVGQEKDGRLCVPCEHVRVSHSPLCLLGGGAGRRPVGNVESCQAAVSFVLTKDGSGAECGQNQADGGCLCSWGPGQVTTRS